MAYTIDRYPCEGSPRLGAMTLHPEPESVSRARRWFRKFIAPYNPACSIDDCTLMISELVTNAIRYGAPPVRVRLLLGRTLVCEVSDGSNTSPRPRQATTTDEGGRGLFLVSQFAERWGTRYAAHDKVIWAELNPGGVTEPDPTALLDQLAW